MKRADVINIIKNNGGNYAASMTKAVTHLIVADKNELSQKITSAKNTGVKVVGEDFLSSFV